MGVFELYKKGQGVVARWIAAGSLVALGAFGAYQFHDWLMARGLTARLPLGVASLPWAGVLATLFLLAAAALAGWLVNYPRFVDYLINCEAELRKVSWPTRAELRRQTIIVLISLAFFSVLLLVADTIFGFVITGILFGFRVPFGG